jgi:hypothetical protein
VSFLSLRWSGGILIAGDMISWHRGTLPTVESSPRVRHFSFIRRLPRLGAGGPIGCGWLPRVTTPDAVATTIALGPTTNLTYTRLSVAAGRM